MHLFRFNIRMFHLREREREAECTEPCIEYNRAILHQGEAIALKRHKLILRRCVSGGTTQYVYLICIAEMWSMAIHFPVHIQSFIVRVWMCSLCIVQAMIFSVRKAYPSVSMPIIKYTGYANLCSSSQYLRFHLQNVILLKCLNVFPQHVYYQIAPLPDSIHSAHQATEQIERKENDMK